MQYLRIENLVTDSFYREPVEPSINIVSVSTTTQVQNPQVLGINGRIFGRFLIATRLSHLHSLSRRLTSVSRTCPRLVKLLGAKFFTNS